jgi:hypothetical protein
MSLAVVHLAALCVIIGAGLTYLIFLAVTWQQMQRDRTAAYSRIDKIIDKAEVAPDDGS